MPLQIRVSEPDTSNGITLSNPIVLERADNIVLSVATSSSDESISFQLPLNDPKMSYIDELHWWECWDTETNKRLNYGPFNTENRTSGDNKTITGPGRSAIFLDYSKSVQTFYEPIDTFIDDLRFENVAAGPKTKTFINKSSSSDYYGLSKRTKDMAIDEQTGYISPGRDTPVRGTIKTDNFWSGVDQSDYLGIDLGQESIVSKARILLPWWSSATINNGRAYDWRLQTAATKTGSYTSQYATSSPNYHPTYPPNGQTIYFGEDGFEIDQVTGAGSPVSSRYWKLDITDTHAWSGSQLNGSQPTDIWTTECVQNNGVLTAPIPTKSIAPENDCHASAVEIGLFKKIIERDTVSAISYRQIENDSRQITYYHEPESSEMITTATSTIRKFEPGTFFRKVRVSWSGGGITIKDEYNTEVFTNSAGSDIDHLVYLPHYTSVIKIEGSPDSQVTYVDTWKGELDPLSWGGSYAYSDKAGDYFTLHFRGTTLKWFSTVPNGETAGQVRIQLREKDNAGNWSAYTTLESGLTLPTNIAGEKVYEITEQDNILADNTVYELKVTNLNGGYVSVDSFQGYWSASYNEYNEDDARLRFRKPNSVVQLYDETYSSGTIHEYRSSISPAQSIVFTGDRVIILSRKGPNYGTVTIALIAMDDTFEYGRPGFVVDIPGGSSDGTLTVDLNHATEIPQAVIFDSNDFFDGPGLPWGNYMAAFYTFGASLNAPVYIDAMNVHETNGLSVKYVDTTYLEIIKSLAEALQLEWEVTEQGLRMVPRIGTDTNIIFKEGTGKVTKISTVKDSSNMATELIIKGADIDGLPLTAVLEDKVSRDRIGRTIRREYDLRGVGDYFTLVGAGRLELRRRRYPIYRYTIEWAGDNLPVVNGDSFLVWTGEITKRLRANVIRRSQSASAGTTYSLECTEWPLIP